MRTAESTISVQYVPINRGNCINIERGEDMTFADEVDGITSWLFEDGGKGKPKIYVNISCVNSTPEKMEECQRIVGQKSYDNQLRQFLEDRQLTLGDENKED